MKILTKKEIEKWEEILRELDILKQYRKNFNLSGTKDFLEFRK